MRKSLQMLPVAAAFLAVIQVSPAEARIRCVDEFQIVNGSRILTPYCQDNYLAKVARTYGQKVSAASVRNNPTVKSRLSICVQTNLQRD